MSEIQFKKIGFVGLGLIGGSIARLMREKFPKIQIFGFARHQATIDYALNNKIIDTGSIEQNNIPKDLDLVFICTPINLINDYLVFLSNHIEKDLVLTDVGSIKEVIGKGISLRPNHIFIGGHPMAGTEKTGIEFSAAKIMYGATYLLIKNQTPQYQAFHGFIKQLDFRVLEVSLSEHDKFVAYASHFPYLMASLTTRTARKISQNELDRFKYVISTGFYDTTRVTSASPEWGIDVCKYNKNNLLEAIGEVKNHLNVLEDLIQKQDLENLRKFLQENKDFRDSLYKK